MSAPGNRGPMLSPTSMIASTPRPIVKVHGLAAEARAMRDRACSSQRTGIRLHAEHRGRLQNENMAGDADEKAGRHRNGQKIGDEAEA